jgi:hypothetical protein
MEAALHASITALLQADPAVAARLGDPLRLADRPRPGLATPYAWWSGARSEEERAGAVRLLTHRVSLNVYSRQPGGEEVREVLNAMREALVGARPDPGPGWRLVSFAPVLTDVLTLPEIGALRGLLRLRAVLEASP